MKSYPDRLRELYPSKLISMIEQQEKEIEIMQRDLDMIKKFLEEKKKRKSNNE